MENIWYESGIRKTGNRVCYEMSARNLMLHLIILG